MNLLNTFRRKLIEFTIVTNPIKKLKRSDTIQKKKLEKLLKYIASNKTIYDKIYTPYKSNLWERPLDIFQSLPIVNKNFVKSALKTNKINKNNLIERRTGGSSGSPLVFYQKHIESQYAASSYQRAKQYHKFNPYHDVLLQIGGFNHIKIDKKYNFLKYLIDGKSSTALNVLDTFDNQLKTLNDNQFSFIYGYPSYIKEIAKWVSEKKVCFKNKIKFIFTASEVLTDKDRQFIEEKLNAQIVNIYGSWEAGCIAWEIEKGKFVVNSDMIIAEVLTENGLSFEGTGELIITNLNQYTVPFIRYNLGDIVTLKKLKFKGSKLLFITHIEGRKDDYIILHNRQIPPSSFTLPLNRNFNLEKYQIIQNKKDELEIPIVSSNKNIHINIKQYFLEKFPDLKIKIKYVNKILRTKQGKYKSVISNVKK